MELASTLALLKNFELNVYIILLVLSILFYYLPVEANCVKILVQINERLARREKVPLDVTVVQTHTRACQ